MPRFYFDIDGGTRRAVDGRGVELPGVDAACRQALAVLPAIARDELSRSVDRELVIHVRDTTGRTVFEASLSLRTRRAEGEGPWRAGRPGPEAAGPEATDLELGHCPPVVDAASGSD